MDITNDYENYEVESITLFQKHKNVFRFCPHCSKEFNLFIKLGNRLAEQRNKHG